MQLQELTPASGSPPAKVDTDVLERSLNDLVNTLMKRWHWAAGTGTTASVPDDLADEMQAIAKVMTSLLSANDIAWAILQITLTCDAQRQPWMINRRRRVLENLFDGLVGRDGKKEKMN
jgi:hypothetical protein